MAPKIMETKYSAKVFLPITLLITNIEATLTAGPAIKSTNAVPGERPFSIKATAIGIDPVAHKYIGIANTKTRSMLSSGLSEKMAKNESGTKTVISPATTNPIRSHLPISCIISTKA